MLLTSRTTVVVRASVCNVWTGNLGGIAAICFTLRTLVALSESLTPKVRERDYNALARLSIKAVQTEITTQTKEQNDEAWHCFQTCVLPGADKPVAVSTALARALLPLCSLGQGMVEDGQPGHPG